MSVMCDIWGSDSSGAEYSRVLWYCTLSLGVTFLTFENIPVTLPSVTVEQYCLIKAQVATLSELV